MLDSSRHGAQSGIREQHELSQSLNSQLDTRAYAPMIRNLK